MRNEVDEGSSPAGHELIPNDSPEAVYRSPPPLLAIGFVLVGGALILLRATGANRFSWSPYQVLS